MANARRGLAPSSLAPRLRLLAWAALVIGVVAVVVSYGELSARAFVAVLAFGSVVAGLGLARRAGSGQEAVGHGGLPWLLLVVIVALWELFAFVENDRLPTLSDLADPVLAHAVPRGLATIGWLAAGFWLIARPRSRSAP